MSATHIYSSTHLSAFDDISGIEFYEEEAMEDDEANFGSGSLVDLLFEIRKSMPVEFEVFYINTCINKMYMFG